MTTIESRATWGARPSRGSSFLGSTRGVKGHYTGGAVSSGTLTDHEKCRAAVRGIQNGHMDGNGWNDIGYSMIVCDHGVAMIGRGPKVLPAANGPGLNSGHYAILVLVGTSGVIRMTDNMKRAFHGARAYLQTHGAAGPEIKGHRDGYATSCPGSSVYPWITSGAALPGATPAPAPTPTPTPVPTPEAHTVDYSAFGFNGPAVPVPAGEWFNVPWPVEYSDPYGSHSGEGSTVLAGEPCLYTLEFGATLAGLPAGTRVLVQTAEYRYDGTATPPVDRLEEEGDPTPHMIELEGLVHHSAVGSVQDGRKLRLQIKTPVAATLTRARVRLLSQR